MQLWDRLNKGILAFAPHAAASGHSSVGFDIGSHSLKVVKIDRKGGSYRVSLAEACRIEGSNLVRDAVKSVTDKLGAEDKAVNLGLSGQQVVIRPVLFPDMSDNNFKNALKYEAAKHIPFAIEEVILDASILSHNVDNNKMLVLIVAAKKDFVRQRIKLLSDLGFEPAVIDVDSLAVTNAFQVTMKSQQKGNEDGISEVALLNIGSRISSLVFLERGLVRFSRDIVFGGHDITAKIASQLSLDIASAEQKKLSEGDCEAVKEAAAASLAGLISELRLSFDYYESQTGKAVSNVYLSGGCSCLTGIEELMARAMNISFKTWNPFSALGIDADAEKEAEKANKEGRSGYFAVAAGLALR